MKITHPKLLYFCLFLFCICSTELTAQLGFCGGSSGEPIFMEDFGSGTTDGPALPPNATTYNFTTGTPNDGDYTISSTTNYFDWQNVQDHTPGDTNGKSLIVNANFTAGEFYRQSVPGLCENTTYEFSSWLINLQPLGSCEGNSIPVNVRFEIWDETDTTRLAFGDTGSIFATGNAQWEQYALVFITEPGQTSVILKMRNNSSGGCGNDLAIDDLVFKSCGDTVLVSDNNNNSGIVICEDQGSVTKTITATPDFSIFTTHAYQWQQSTDLQNWSDIQGETSETFITPAVVTTTYFRVKIAEDTINVNNDLCNIVSDIYEITLVPIPAAPISSGDVTVCEGDMGSLIVTVPPNFTVNWYDAPVGGTLLRENIPVYETGIAGTYYAETNSTEVACASPTRTALSLIVNPLPVVTDENLTFCETTITILSADLDNVSYQWNTGATTKEIEAGTPGNYNVLVTDVNGCTAIKNIQLEQIDIPKIETINSDGPSIIITTSNQGNFRYSLNGIDFQNSPIFDAVSGGNYTIYVQDDTNCGTATQEFLHLVIPKFITPNGDNANDVFTVEGIELSTSFKMEIYDRYGTLLKSGNRNSPFWDGTFNGNLLPSDDYWYFIMADDSIFKGHFTLKR